MPAPAAPHQLPGQPDFRYSGTELVMLYDYKVPCKNFREVSLTPLFTSASKSSIRRFVITEKAPTRDFSWLKEATTAFTFKTLIRHYAKQAG